jgi:hypothetical protein
MGVNRSLRLMALVNLAALLTLPVSAQTRPDFSGKWVLVPEKSVLQRSQGTVRIEVFGEEFTATQDAETLVIWNSLDTSGSPYVYKLDGTETTFIRQAVTGPRELTFGTRWEGNTLILITASKDADGERMSVEFRMGFSIDRFLLIQAPWGPDRSMVESVYKKQLVGEPR